MTWFGGQGCVRFDSCNILSIVEIPQTCRVGWRRPRAGIVSFTFCTTAQPAAPSANVLGANDTLRVAVIGTNGRGLAHVECLTDGLPNVTVAAICDVDDRAIAKGIKETLKRQKSEPKGIKDFRKVLEDKSIDAVTIATPDHWHAPMAILALAAGKHVYVEKPCSHNPREGELLIEAVAKYGRVCQMGNQRRSFPTMHEAMELLHGGMIGKLVFARAWYTNKRDSIGHGKAAPVPEWLDYELWQGPAPRKAFVDNLIHYNWHWHWHWGTGEALNNGTHEVDVCRWALGVDWPTRVTSNGGRYFFQDDWETPDTQVISWDYADGKSITWEGRSCNGFPMEGLDRGALIYRHERCGVARERELHDLRQRSQSDQEREGERGGGPDEYGERERDRAGPVAREKFPGLHSLRQRAEFADHGGPQERGDVASRQYRVAHRSRTELRPDERPHPE